MKKILITGGTGLIGSRIQELLSKEFDFVNASLEQGIDLLDLNQLNRFVSENQPASALLHLAAFTKVAEAEKQRGDKNDLCYRLNTEATRQLAQSCAKVKLPLIYFSTDYVFDGTRKGEVYTEEDEPNPINWYGQTKLWGEQAVQELCPRFTILRTAYPFRARFEKKIDFVRQIKTLLEQGTLYPMFTDQIITPTFIDDIAEGFRRVLQRPLQNQIFHLVGPTRLTPYQAAQLIARAVGLDPQVVKPGSLEAFIKEDPERKNLYPASLALSNHLFSQVFAFQPQAFEKALMQIIKA